MTRHEFGNDLHRVIGRLYDEQAKSGMGSHQSTVNEKDEWLTPPFIIAALSGAQANDLDPCAPPPTRRLWDTARVHYSIENDGLAQPWRGRVWLNPPYGGPAIVGPWMRRMAQHGNGIALIFARTETELFFETVWNDQATAVLFIRGRLFFHVSVDTWFERKRKESIFVRAGDPAPANGGAPSVLIAYGESAMQTLWQANHSGAIAGKFVRLK